MAQNRNYIRIESIEGGISSYEYISGQNQYVHSYSIDPDNSASSIANLGAGYTTLNPTCVLNVTSTTLTSDVMWMEGPPRGNENIYLYDMNGSVYTFNETSVTGLADLNDGGTAHANGMAYYDNYMYFARDTTIARYGPLDGTPAWTMDYWVTTLSKARLRLQPTEYRNSGYSDSRYPNHVLHRHTNGALYIADVSGGQGVIHKIQTKKTTVEGDTDDGSTYGALYLPYGYIPTDIESYGDDLVIAAFEGNATGPEDTSYGSDRVNEGRASLFFWDTTSSNYYKHIQREIPDQYISALANANGVLYLFCSPYGTIEPSGVRLMRYLGGNSFEQLFYNADSDTAYPGGVITRMNQILWTSTNLSNYGTTGPAVWALGSQNQPLSNAIHCVAGATTSSGTGLALFLEDNGAAWGTAIYYTCSGNNGSFYLNRYGDVQPSWDTDLRSPKPNASWTSPWYHIGNDFKVKKVRFYIDHMVSSMTDLRVYLTKDRQSDYTEIARIDNTNYPGHSGAVVIRPNDFSGELSVQLVFEWYGTTSVPIALPIEIEYELYDDE